METTPHHDLTWEQRRLLGGWQDVADDAKRFAAALEAVPDGCGCGDGRTHLKGTCSCCLSDERHAGCVDCEVLLHGLSWRVDALIEDTSRYMHAVSELLAHVWPDDGEARLRDVKQRIARVAHSMTRLETSAGEFARGCGLDRLQELRTTTAELLANVQELGHLLIPRQSGPTRYTT